MNGFLNIIVWCSTLLAPCGRGQEKVVAECRLAVAVNLQKETSGQYTGWKTVSFGWRQYAVLPNLSNNTLRKNMPYESLSDGRRHFSHLEAVGRVVCGIAPWLELGEDETSEGKLCARYIDLTVRGTEKCC